MRKRSLLMLVFLIFIFALMSGCQKKEPLNTQETSRTEGESDKTQALEEEAEDAVRIIDGYREFRYSMPEDLTYVLTPGARFVEGTGLIIVGSGRDNAAYVWTSLDYGVTWEEPVPIPDELQLVEDEGDKMAGSRSPIAAAISSTGEIAFIRITFLDENNMTYDYWTWKPEGKLKQMDIELDMDDFYKNGESYPGAAYTKPNAFRDWKYTEDNLLLAQALNRQMFLIDPENGEILDETPYTGNMQTIEYAGVIDGQIMMQTADEVRSYNLETKEYMDSVSGLTEDMLAMSREGQTTSVGNKYELVATKNGIYQLGKSGIFQGTGEQKREIISGEQALFGGGNILYVGLSIVNEQDFIIPCVENGRYFILFYQYTGEEDSISGGSELAVYSLRNNDNVAQAIELYRSENPEMDVKFETGLSGDADITVSDAIRSLSARIMANDGPDVILLDYMPIERYIERGILKDITDIFEEINESQGILENIATAYEDDGRIYALPTHFYVPVILGEQEAPESDKHLAEYIENLYEQGEKQVLAGMDVRGLIERLAVVSSGAWMTEKSELDEEKVREFIDIAVRICDSAELENSGESKIGEAEDIRSDNIQPLYFASGHAKIVFGTSSGFGSISQISSAIQQRGSGIWGLMNGQVTNVFAPSAIVGISERAENPDAARVFVKYLLSQEVQALEMGSGFPVNRKAIQQLIEQQRNSKEWILSSSDPNTGDVIDFYVKAASEEELEKFRKLLETLEIPELTDQTIVETVKEFTLSCAAGEISQEEALENIISRVQLYLAE